MTKVHAETPISFIQAIVAAYKKYGKDPSQALAHARIAPELLLQNNSRVTSRQMELLSAAAMKELDDETPGWFSRRLPWGSFGMLCRASLPSANLGIALNRWCRHFKILTDDITQKMTVDGNGIAHLCVYENTDLGQFRELCLVSTLRNIHAYACWVINSHIPLIETRMPFQAPAHKSAYKHIFGSNVRFNESHTSFSFSADYLKLSVRRDDKDLRQMLVSPLPLIVLRYRRDRLLYARVRNYMRSHNYTQWTADAVADGLGMSKRSLFRHLEYEGLSLQELKNEVRKDLAMHQLSVTNRPVKQIAASVGFASESSFVRAFRSWTGRSPGVFRAQTKNTSSK